MSSRMRVPAKATVKASVSGRVNEGANKGRPVTITIYTAPMSKGYKSDFQFVLTYYVRTVWHDTGKVNTFSQTGRNIEKLEQEFENIKGHILPM